MLENSTDKIKKIRHLPRRVGEGKMSQENAQ